MTFSNHPTTNTTPSLPDDTSSEENIERQSLRVTEEERRGTIPRSTEATAMACTLQWAQANYVVKRSHPLCVKKSTSAKSVQQAATQTEKEPKNNTK